MNRWLYGSLINNAFFANVDGSANCQILDTDYIDYDCFEDIGEQLSLLEVDPKSVGQYTGLKDINDTEVYEGDEYHLGDPNITYTVVWNDTGLIGKQNGSSSYAGLSHWQERIEIVGNIYEGAQHE